MSAPALRAGPTRAALVRVHRWTGLALGALFALLGVTGSFNVYHRELDAWLNPAYHAVSTGPTRVSVDEALARARARHPQMRVLNIALADAQQPYWIWFRDTSVGDGDASLQFQIAVDPVSGAVVGPRLAWGGISFSREALARTVYRLHYELWAGPAGKTVVGLTGLFMLVSLLLGISLWWPRRGAWRAALRVKRGASPLRATFDWHRTIGASGAVLLAVSAFSGAYMIFPEYFHAAAKPFGKVDDLKAPVRAASGPVKLTLEEAVQISRTRWPDAMPRFVVPARAPGEAIRVRLFREGEANTFGRSFMWVDPSTGHVLRVLDGLSASPVARFFNWQFPLHNGAIAGQIGRAAVFAAGLLPLALFVTGCVIWRAKRRPREAATTKRSEPLSARASPRGGCARIRPR